MEWNDTSETETDSPVNKYIKPKKRILKPHESSEESSSEDEPFPTPFEDGKPLQLIQIGTSSDGEENLQLILNSDVFDQVLDTCGNRSICIICSVGGPRTGKSFLLNCIKETVKTREIDSRANKTHNKVAYYKGFNVKSGYKAVTKGIWVWSKAFIVEGEERDEIAVLLMDTEGVNDELCKPEEIAAILGIPLLSSTHYILNFTGDLSLAPFNWLSKFAGKRGGKHDNKRFQKLSILVHDWTRIGMCRYGEKGGRKRFRQFIRNHDDQVSPIITAFDEVDCHLLPNAGEKTMLPSFNGKSSDLNKDFLKYLQRYVSGLLGRLSTKKTFECELKAPEFKQFVEGYVAFFNNSSSEMGFELNPDALISLSKNTAGKIMIARGVEEYHQYFKQRNKSANGGFVRESTLNGLHVQAKKRAFQALKMFSLSEDEERQFKLKLDAEISKEKQDLQSENMSARKLKIRKCLEKACSDLRSELKRKFPFTPEPGEQVPTNLVFYDEDQLSNVLSQVSKSIKEEFLEEFSGDDDDEIGELEAGLDSELKPVGDEFTCTNQGNKRRALDKAQALIENFLEEYTSGMQKKIQRLPKLDAGTLGVFHDDLLEKMEHKFETVQLGSSFKADCWVKLLDCMDNEHLKLQCNLESVMAQAMEQIEKEEAAYKKLLTDAADKMSDENEIKQFHERSIEQILERFQGKNPFPGGSPKYELMESTLRKNLDNVYKVLIEAGVCLKRKQEEFLTDVSKRNIKALNDNLEKCIQDSDFLGEDECQNYLKSTYKQVLKQYEKEVTEGSSKMDKDTLEAVKASFVVESKEVMNNWQMINKEIRNVAIEEAGNLMAQIVQQYEAKMKKSMNDFGRKDEFTEEHEKLKFQLAEKFRMQCSSKKKSFVEEYIGKVEVMVNEISSELGYLFEVKQRAEDVVIKEALLEARKYYQENIEKAFGNKKEGYFDEKELEQLSNQFRETAIQNVNVEPPLNPTQLTIVKDRLNKLYVKYKERNELVRHSYNDQDLAIGIDLGTTYCCVAVYHKGKVQILRNELGSNTTPSYVTISPDGIPLVGSPSKDLAYRNPESTIFDAKRIIGRRWNDEKLQEDIQFWPFSVVEHEGTPKIKVNDTFYPPHQISSMILKHLKQEAEQILKLKIRKAVITVPAYFTDGQRQATIEAGKLAGLEVLAILNEPTAAAVAYRLEWYTVGRPRKILVYDLGGGTFDVAILEISEDKLDVLSIAGDSHLGGEDFDKNMMSYCVEEFKKGTKIDLLEGKDATTKTTRDEVRRRLKRLQTNCENSKKGLANARNLTTPTTISIDEIQRGHDLNVEINRQIFDDKNAALFERTIKIVDDALAAANLKKNDIDDVVLVGGSTRITKLQQMLEKHFNGKPLNKQINPDEAVAYGAAVQAAILNAKPGTKVFDFGRIQEITPMSLGIEIDTGNMDVIIRRGTKIPHTHTQKYSTTKDNQKNVSIKIFQGEELKVAQNKLLGNFILSGIPLNKAGNECVEVTMKINLNGVLSVEAMCTSTKKKMSITIGDDKGKTGDNTGKKGLAEAC